MKENGKKIAGILFMFVGGLDFIEGVVEGTFYLILLGLSLVLIGSLYFVQKRK